MVNTPLDFKYIYKRERYLEKKIGLHESSGIPDLSKVSDAQYKSRVESYVKNSSSFKDILNLMETLYRDDKFELLESTAQVMINEIIPTVEGKYLDACINDINQANIGIVNNNRLIETAKMYKSIDRINRNHRNLTKRFGFENFNHLSNRKKCFNICEKVCAYNLSPFIKFNIALEEIAYMGFVNGNRMPDSEMVKNVLEYFLMIGENSNEDIKSYRKAISSSKVIKEGADEEVKYIYGSKSYNDFEKSMNEWFMNTNKNINGLIEIARNNYSDINSLNKVLNTIKEFTYINELEFNPMDIFKEFKSLSAKEAENIVSIITENNISNTEDLVYNLRCIWESEINDSVYDDGTETPETFTSDEIDKFKMRNLISDAKSTGDFLSQLEKSYMKNMISITKIRNIDSDVNRINENNFLDYIDCNGYIDIKLESYSYKGCSIDEANAILNSTVNCMNNALYGRDSRVFYTIGENSFDISIRTKYKVITSLEQDMRKGFTESDVNTLSNIVSYAKAIETISESTPIYDIANKLNDRYYAATVSYKEVALIADILNPYTESGNSIVEDFVELCREEANKDYDKMKKVLMNIKEESFNPYEDHATRLKFCAEVMGITEAAEDDEDKNEKDKSSNKSNSSNDSAAKKNINSLNDAKLAWQGIKSKLKGLSAKEQEMSNDLDIEFNHLMKTLGSAFSTNHREEIITGEVNRSLSKAIKIGIGLAGAGLAIGKIFSLGAATPVLPIIAAVAMFAKSKFSSLKEKKMILDEIDIELKVLDREINRAEQSGSTKKYRQLLTIQKNLMRKRQEIYYGLAKKGKRIPMQATAGLRERE